MNKLLKYYSFIYLKKIIIAFFMLLSIPYNYFFISHLFGHNAFLFWLIIFNIIFAFLISLSLDLLKKIMIKIN